VEAFKRKNFIQLLGLTGVAFLLPKNLPAEIAIEPKLKRRSLRIAHLTDIHVDTTHEASYGMNAALEAVNNLPDKPDLIINGGDAIMNKLSMDREKLNKQWKLFHHINSDANSLEMYHCIGNHDLYGFALPHKNNDVSKRWALDEYQMEHPYYSFQKNDWHFIVLDSIHPRISTPGYFGKIDIKQIEWLRSLLLNIPKTQNICIVSHIPILSVCSLFDGKGVDHSNWCIPDVSLHSDAAMLRDLFYEFPNIKCCLSGHIHLIDHVNYLGIDYYCDGAVCGAWWKGDHQQFAPSFSVINFYTDGTTDREVYYYKWKLNLSVKR
jgi:Icc protein